jgi:hypothetical protein
MFTNLPENYLASGVAASHVSALIAKYSTAPAYKGKVGLKSRESHQYKLHIIDTDAAHPAL